MLVPLIFTLLFYFYFDVISFTNWQYKTIAICLFTITFLLCAASLAVPFLPLANKIGWVYLKSLFLFAGF